MSSDCLRSQARPFGKSEEGPCPDLRFLLFWLSVKCPVGGYLVGNCLVISGKMKVHKEQLLGPETARWGGGLPCKGAGVEKFVLSFESLSSLSFGMSRTPGGVQNPLWDDKGCFAPRQVPAPNS